mgnify:CR=1 FL=1
MLSFEYFVNMHRYVLTQMCVSLFSAYLIKTVEINYLDPLGLHIMMQKANRMCQLLQIRYDNSSDEAIAT